MRKAIENIWYHYKVQIVLAAVILTAGIYMVLQQISMPAADYDVAIVSPEFFSEEQAEKLRNILASFGTDCTGDGIITVNTHFYTVSLSAENQDSSQIGALDADLTGNMSGLFLLAEPDIFEEVTNGICRAEEAVSAGGIVPLSEAGMETLFLAVREGCDEKYAVMLKNITA